MKIIFHVWNLIRFKTTKTVLSSVLGYLGTRLFTVYTDKTVRHLFAQMVSKNPLILNSVRIGYLPLTRQVLIYQESLD